jgi:hypothetical protein
MPDIFYKGIIYVNALLPNMDFMQGELACEKSYTVINPPKYWKDKMDVKGLYIIEKRVDDVARDAALKYRKPGDNAWTVEYIDVAIPHSPEFELEDIEDAKVIIMVKGKHYSIISTGDKEEAKMYRVALVKALLSMEGQIIVVPSLEEIKSNQ